MFFMIRGVNKMYVDSVLAKRQRKKIKYENFVDWFFLKKHQLILPKSRIFWYFFNFVLFGITLLVTVLFYIFEIGEAGKIGWIYFVINGIWLILAWFNFL